MNKFKKNYLKKDNLIAESIYRIFEDTTSRLNKEVNYNYLNSFIKLKLMSIIYDSMFRIQMENTNNLRLNGD